MTENKLFKSGCSLCGATQWRPGPPKLCLQPTPDYLYCGDCWDSHGGEHKRVTAEITRRAALAAEQKGAEAYVPKKGEMCHGFWRASSGREHQRQGRFVEFKESTSPSEPRRMMAWLREDGVSGSAGVETYSLRPGPQPTCPGEGGYACNCGRCTSPANECPKPVEAKREDPYAEHLKTIAAKFGYAPDVTTELLDYQVAWATKDRAELTRPAAFPSREPPPRIPVEHPAAFPADAFLDAWTCDP